MPTEYVTVWVCAYCGSECNLNGSEYHARTLGHERFTERRVWLMSSPTPPARSKRPRSRTWPDALLDDTRSSDVYEVQS